MKKMEKEERTDLVEEIVEAEERTVEQQQQQQPEAEATAEEHAAARTIQATFRRRVASRRMGTIRKINLKHTKLKALHPEHPNWTKEDSVASMLQSAFHMQHARRATRRAASFMQRGSRKVCGEDVLEVLDLPIRSDEDLAQLLQYFADLEFFQQLEGRMKQLQACRYVKLRSAQIGVTLFSAGDVGDKFYILLRGAVEVRVESQVTAAGVKLECGPGDAFGEQSLHGENDGRRDATVSALKDSVLAEIERADYLRLTDTLIPEVIKVLAAPVESGQRTAVKLQLCRYVATCAALDLFEKPRFSFLYNG
jgi:hypothetical protein